MGPLVTTRVPWRVHFREVWHTLPPKLLAAVPEALRAAVAELVLACVPKVACVVVLPGAGWPGVEVGAWAGAAAACFPPLESGGAPEERA